MLLGLKLANDSKRLRSTQDYDDASRYEIWLRGMRHIFP